jgi:phosphate transport system protein
MREVFHKDLDKLQTDVVAMAEHARGMLKDGTQALVDLDTKLADDVDSRKVRLAEEDERIELEALQLVARQQPMARDMRAVGAALKLITYINRVGRYGKDIAVLAKEWPEQGHIGRLVQIPYLTETVIRMFDHVMECYKSRKPVDIETLTDWEDTVDATRYTVFRECVSYMMEDAKNIERCAHYMMIARYLERCGDNVCKMAEKTHYMVTGHRVTIK